MATKNLVPRENNEGNIGVSSRKWKNAFFTNGNFDKVLTNELKNISDNELLVAGDNITIDYANNQYTINSSGGGSSISSIFDLSDIKTNATDSTILVYKDDANDDSNDGFYAVNISGHASINNTGALTISETLFDGTQLKDSNDAPESPANDDRFLMYDADAATGSKLKYVKKSELLSNLKIFFMCYIKPHK